MSKEIQLTRGMVAIVDDGDFERLNQWKWNAQKGKHTFYAQRHSGTGADRNTVMMHNQVMSPADGMTLDHANGNGLDNQRHNLRQATVHQQNANRRKSRARVSQFKGVSLSGSNASPWMARIGIGGKRLYLGSFRTEEEAARAYDVAAEKHFGEFASLNFQAQK